MCSSDLGPVVDGNGNPVVVSLYATDAAGNRTAATAVGFTVDAAAPALALTQSIVAGDNVVNRAEAAATGVPITGTVTGLGDGDQLYLQVGTAKPIAVTVGPGGVFATNSGVPVVDGNGNPVAVSLYATDAAGNRTAATTVGFTVDAAAPALALKIGRAHV